MIRITDITDIAKEAGFDFVEGKNATLKMIKDVAGPDTLPLCSGYGVFPDGKKCTGCDDCKQDNRKG